MSRLVYLLLISLTLLFISCDNNETTKVNECTPSCEEWKTCDDSETCVLNSDRCDSNADCADENKTECNTTTHFCEEKIVVICEEGATKCEDNTLSTCENNSWNEVNCETDNKICQTENNSSSCVDKESLEKTIPEVKALVLADEETKDVITTGVVTYVGKYESKVSGFYIQESTLENGAIYVFIKNGVNSPIKLGDTVTVTGKAWSRFGVNRIGDDKNIPTFEITDNTTSVPTPKELDTTSLTLGEVDMLVNMKDTPFTVVKMGDAPKYDTIIKDALGNELIIKSKLYRFNENGLTVGSQITHLTGIGSSYQYTSDESFDFSVQPRDASDIIFTNDGTEGHICRDTDPKCIEGLVCKANRCEIKVPCDNLCTDSQYCNIETDLCVDYVLQDISDVRNMESGKHVYVEGVVNHYERDGQGKARFFIQDNTTNNSGIEILYRDPNEVNPPVVSVGDKLKVTGLTNNYRDIIQIGNLEVIPTLEVIDSGIDLVEKDIDYSGISEENLFILVKMLNPPFTVTSVERAYPKYVTLADSLGNSFLLNNDFVENNEYFIVGDILTELKGIVTFRYFGGEKTYHINPRSFNDFTFKYCDIEDSLLCDGNSLMICAEDPNSDYYIWTEFQNCEDNGMVCKDKGYEIVCESE